jgi:hypothetical protein
MVLKMIGTYTYVHAYIHTYIHTYIRTHVHTKNSHWHLNLVLWNLDCYWKFEKKN